MDMQTALTELGLRDGLLDAAEIAQLDEKGYLPLPDILSPTQVAAIRARFQEITITEGAAAGKEFRKETGTQRLANLVDKDPLFDICFSHPRVLAAMKHVLRGDFKLSSLNGRASLPGEGAQALHADWPGGVDPSDFQVCNSIWLLVDFTRENGATRVVPGSHKSGLHPQTALADAWARHVDEELLTGRAGTVVIFNSHLWHGGTINKTAAPRYALHAYFTRRHNPQQVCQRDFLSAATVARLRPAQRFILDL